VPNIVIAGKTGTTENYGDAWFVGWTPDYTIAIWVGYPDKLVPMKTEFNGEPVAGGTFPASIFRTFVQAILRLHPPKQPKPQDIPIVPSGTVAPAPTTAAPAAPTPRPTSSATSGLTPRC
jgi:penicillin-binding protein 1A